MGGVNVPLVGRVAFGHDLLHQFQGAGDDGAAGFPGVEELLFVDFAGTGVVADEHHFDLVVVALEEQVQKDEKAFGDVLGGLGHGPGNVHQAEHHGFGTGIGLLDQQVVLEVEGVEERYAVYSCAQALNFGFYFLNIAEIVWFFPFKSRQFLLRYTQFGAAAARQRDASGVSRAQRADDVDA
ncbi:hypothetical protein D9M71_490980 [compost metagenome]